MVHIRVSVESTIKHVISCLSLSELENPNVPQRLLMRCERQLWTTEPLQVGYG